MKKKLLLLAAAAASVACLYLGNSRPSNYTAAFVTTDTLPDRPVYIDLATGDTLDAWYNGKQGRMYNRKNNQPLSFYINTRTGDTVYGHGRMVVNGMIVRNANGTWNWDSTKVKVDNDGKVKMKDANKKWKMDAEGTEKIKDRHRDSTGAKWKAKTDNKGQMKVKNKGDKNGGGSQQQQ